MKNRLLLAAMALTMFASGPAWAETSKPTEPPASAAASNACPADNSQAAPAEGDPSAPQNQVEYGGGA